MANCFGTFYGEVLAEIGFIYTDYDSFQNARLLGDIMNVANTITHLIYALAYYQELTSDFNAIAVAMILEIIITVGSQVIVNSIASATIATGVGAAIGFAITLFQGPATNLVSDVGRTGIKVISIITY